MEDRGAHPQYTRQPDSRSHYAYPPLLFRGVLFDLYSCLPFFAWVAGGGGGGDIPLYDLYRDAPLDRVFFMFFFCPEQGIYLNISLPKDGMVLVMFLCPRKGPKIAGVGISVACFF